jgi:hypothetical protein
MEDATATRSDFSPKRGFLMPKPVSWSYRTHEIRERVQHSKTQTWTRRDIEDLFEVKRATAQTLMKAIGGVQNIGGTHLLDREALLEFLEQTIAADDVSGAVRSRRQEAAPSPQPRRLTISLPNDLKSVMAADLPSNIELSPGRLTISGKGSEGIINDLYLLAQAMQNDLGSIQARLDPMPERKEVGDPELRRLFASLARKERK